MNILTNEDKIAYILNDLAKNYQEFLKQATFKLKKQSKILNPDKDASELVSDVTFSVIDKLKTIESIDRFHYMAWQNTLKLYILKAIDCNTRFYSSPFLRGKLKIHNRTQYDDIKDYVDDTNDIEVEELRKEWTVNIILDMLEQPNAERIFGEQWWYFTEIFKEYIFNDVSYKDIAIKYSIPVSSISYHLRLCKDLIRAEFKRINKLN